MQSEPFFIVRPLTPALTSLRLSLRSHLGPKLKRCFPDQPMPNDEIFRCYFIPTEKQKGEPNLFQISSSLPFFESVLVNLVYLLTIWSQENWGNVEKRWFHSLMATHQISLKNGEKKSPALQKILWCPVPRCLGWGQVLVSSLPFEVLNFERWGLAGCSGSHM